MIEANRDTGPMHSVEDAGFDRQPPARTLGAPPRCRLHAADGQTLGYPWLGFIENWHEPAFTGFGDGHGVWETSGGTRLPFYSRNLADVTEYLQQLSLTDLMPRVRALEETNFALLPPGPGTHRRLDVTPDEIQSHGLDLKSALSPQGTGLFWAAMERGDALPRTKIVRTDALDGDSGHQSRHHGQGQPALDAGLRHAPRQRSARARRACHDHQHRNKQLWQARPTRRAWPCRRRCRCASRTLYRSRFS